VNKNYNSKNCWKTNDGSCGPKVPVCNGMDLLAEVAFQRRNFVYHNNKMCTVYCGEVNIEFLQKVVSITLLYRTLTRSLSLLRITRAVMLPSVWPSSVERSMAVWQLGNNSHLLPATEPCAWSCCSWC